MIYPLAAGWARALDNYHVTARNMQDCVNELQNELAESHFIIVSTRQGGNVGNWGMAKLWRVWMTSTSEALASRGETMPLKYDSATGEIIGERPFNSDDAHELFTRAWLGTDENGNRLSWSKRGCDGRRPADKGERFHALRRHEIYAMEEKIILLNPRDSEYYKMLEEGGY